MLKDLKLSGFTAVGILFVCLISFMFIYFMGPLSLPDSDFINDSMSRPTLVKSISRSFENPFEGLMPAISQPVTAPTPINDGTVIDWTKCPFGNCYTYMGWQKITSKSSNQYKLRAKYYPDWDEVQGSPNAFDAEGFARIGGRYVVATTHSDDGGVSHIGQQIDVYLKDGIVIPCVVGDIKSSGDASWTQWGHRYGNQVSAIEFIVDERSWYGTGKNNPGTAGNHPEWAQPIVKIVLGSDA